MSIMNRASEESPLHIGLGLVVFITSLVAFGLVEMQVLNDTIAPYAGTVFVGGFFAIYFLSDREIGQLTDAELAALLIPIASVVLIEFVPQFADLVSEFDPYASVALFGLTLGGYYVLSTNLRIGTVALQLILGSILGLTAMLQFDIVTMSAFGTEITDLSVWVFVGTLSIAYFVSEHEIGQMNIYEVGALVVGAGSYLAYNYIPEFATFVDSNNPQAGIVLSLIVIVAYYFIMRNGKLR